MRPIGGPFGLCGFTIGRGGMRIGGCATCVDGGAWSVVFGSAGFGSLVRGSLVFGSPARGSVTRGSVSRGSVRRGALVRTSAGGTSAGRASVWREDGVRERTSSPKMTRALDGRRRIAVGQSVGAG